MDKLFDSLFIDYWKEGGVQDERKENGNRV
nr:MAG TPA: hypothetical protein [Caudoviricetes sp.]